MVQMGGVLQYKLEVYCGSLEARKAQRYTGGCIAVQIGRVGGP